MLCKDPKYLKIEHLQEGFVVIHNQLFVNKIKQKILEIEPNATIILYGSRSRGDAKKNSDWDFLILVDHSFDFHQVEKIRNHLFEIELENNEIISSIVRSHSEWNSPKYIRSPFYQNIKKEGITL